MSSMGFHSKRKTITVFDLLKKQLHIGYRYQLKGDTKQLPEIKDNGLFQYAKKSDSPSLVLIESNTLQYNDKLQIPIDDIPVVKSPIEIQHRELPILNREEEVIESKHVKQPEADSNVIKYKIITNDQSLIKLPPNCKHIPIKTFFPFIDETTDLDIKQLIDLMNEPIDKKVYTDIVIEDTCKIYKKQIEGYDNSLIRSLYSIPYPKDIIFEAISNIDLRKKWDDSFIELRLAGINKSNEAEVLYLSVKSPGFLGDRDFVQQRKILKDFPNEQSCLFHFKSIEYPSCPINPKFVRGETIISGFYIQNDLSKPGHSILGIISHSDIKGNIPTWLVNTVTPKASKNWIKNLLKGCQLVRSIIK